MSIDAIAIFGAGGHAKVAVDALRLVHAGARLEVWDDNPALAGQDFCGMTVQAPVTDFSRLPSSVHVAIGGNSARQRVADVLLSQGKKLLSIHHPSARISSTAWLGQCVLVCAGAIIGPDARIGDGVIVNHGAIVDHDCVIGDWSHVAPGAVLGGEVKIASGCLIGASAVILPGVSVGQGARVGAGAVVTRDVRPGTTVVGTPARDLKPS